MVMTSTVISDCLLFDLLRKLELVKICIKIEFITYTLFFNYCKNFFYKNIEGEINISNFKNTLRIPPEFIGQFFERTVGTLTGKMENLQ